MTVIAKAAAVEPEVAAAVQTLRVSMHGYVMLWLFAAYVREKHRSSHTKVPCELQIQSRGSRRQGYVVHWTRKSGHGAMKNAGQPSVLIN